MPCKIKISKVFKYPTHFERKLFNYKLVSQNYKNYLDVDCYCGNDEYADYVDNHHKHIITGNLDIIENKVLRHIMRYGTKYRLPSLLNVKSILGQFIADIDRFIDKLTVRYSLPSIAFKAWKINMFNYFKSNINNVNKAQFDFNHINKAIRTQK